MPLLFSKIMQPREKNGKKTRNTTSFIIAHPWCVLLTRIGSWQFPVCVVNYVDPKTNDRDLPLSAIKASASLIILID